MPYPNVELKNVRDHATDTLSLALAMGNKVSEVNVNVSKVPTTDYNTPQQRDWRYIECHIS